MRKVAVSLQVHNAAGTVAAARVGLRRQLGAEVDRAAPPRGASDAIGGDRQDSVACEAVEPRYERERDRHGSVEEQVGVVACTRYELRCDGTPGFQ
jgi:hypothetical protein